MDEIDDLKRLTKLAFDEFNKLSNDYNYISKSPSLEWRKKREEAWQAYTIVRDALITKQNILKNNKELSNGSKELFN